ncbi:unnamed protein product, partial [Rotaria sordida]
YRQYQSTKEIRLGELQLELKLKTFEFDLENDNDANKILFSYGYGPSLPTSAKRVIQLEQPLKVMKTVIMNLQNQEPQKLIRRSPSPPLLIINIVHLHHQLINQDEQLVLFDQLNQHNNPPPIRDVHRG